ncbi:hypothetical protein [Streptomyces sp. BE303]|uniref:hypothetical protein n=1 Tax=Streptomyces sp. BE303 TaxID=3002528 RepID=UPI002E7908FF|nr:hypothetical protein [Streptomyces sp. BE303]MED7948866.1 hypothetical protein [Streptomyces sp. BE303]
MARLLARKDRGGLVPRTAARQQHDRRVGLISPTGTGLAKQTRVYSALFETDDQALRGFSAKEIDLPLDPPRRLVANPGENPD